MLSRGVPSKYFFLSISNDHWPLVTYSQGFLEKDNSDKISPFENILQAFIDPAIVLSVHVYFVNHFCDSMWSFWVEMNLCRVFYGLFICVLLLEIQLSKGEGWDPVIKWGGLGSNYQKGRVGIQLSNREGWDPIIKRGELGSSHQKGRVGIPLTGLTLQHFCACPKSEPGFPMSYAVFFYVQWVEVRSDCLFCWCWWNCWPKLFKVSFHNSILFTSCNILN